MAGTSPAMTPVKLRNPTCTKTVIALRGEATRSNEMPFLFLMPMIMFGGMWRYMDDLPRPFVPTATEDQSDN